MWSRYRDCNSLSFQRSHTFVAEARVDAQYEVLQRNASLTHEALPIYNRLHATLIVFKIPCINVKSGKADCFDPRKDRLVR